MQIKIKELSDLQVHVQQVKDFKPINILVFICSALRYKVRLKRFITWLLKIKDLEE